MIGQVPDSILQALSYYPLEVGNEWQYSYNTPSGSSDQTGAFPFQEVISTTLGVNDKWYQKLLEGWRSPYQNIYQRVDTTTATVYRFSPGTVVNGQSVSEYPILYLPTGSERRQTNGDSPYLDCRWRGERDVFGESRRIWSCTQGGGNYSITLEMVAGIGVISKYVDMEQPFQYTLHFARVGEFTTGTKVSTEQVTIDENNRSRLGVFPNPAVRGHDISMTGMDERVQTKVLMIDVAGRIVAQAVYTSYADDVRFRLPHDMAAGVYMLIAQNTIRTKHAVVIVSE